MHSVEHIRALFWGNHAHHSRHVNPDDVVRSLALVVALGLVLLLVFVFVLVLVEVRVEDYAEIEGVRSDHRVGPAALDLRGFAAVAHRGLASAF